VCTACETLACGVDVKELCCKKLLCAATLKFFL
jgi:hypothetical protein